MPHLTIARRAVRCAVVPLLVLAVSACGAQQQGSAARTPQVVSPGKLTVCTNLPYEPFEFDLGGETVGFDVDLAGQVAKRLKMKPVFLNKEFDAIESGELLNQGVCDVAVAGLTITGDRARVIDFSSPYFNAAQALVVPKGSGVTTLADLGGEKIAVQSGTTGEVYLTDNAPSDAEIVTFEDQSAMTNALESGKVLAAVFDNTVVGGIVDQNRGLAVAAEFDTGEQYGMAVKKNGNVDLLRTINDVLATLQKDGGYDKIYSTWFGTA